MQFLYAPLTAYVFFRGLFLERNIFFFATANHKIPLAGFAADSKSYILSHVPQQYKPKTYIVKPSDSITEVFQTLSNNQVDFPVYAKPDIGESGFLVERIDNAKALSLYHQKINCIYIIQEAVQSQLELSYLIHNANGNYEITSLTERRYVEIIGDGSSTVKDLLAKHPSAQYRLSNCLNSCSQLHQLVLAKHQKMQPIQIGNWDFGATYIERTKELDEVMVQTLANIMTQIGMFDYARVDIKCDSIADLRSGNFKILEMNGVKGEPIHIYDPSYSLAMAYIEIFKHWNLIIRISKRNRKNGNYPPTLKEGIELLKYHINTKRNALKQS